MSTSAIIESRVAQGPTVRHMLSLWVPLAASITMMVLEPSIINIGLGRTPDPELALAAYGVAFSLALLVEAPVLLLLDASVARSTDQAAFALVRKFTLQLGFLVTVMGLIVSLTPLYGLIVGDLMNIPPDVAERARPTLQVLSLWPLPIAWRRSHQGVLIRVGRTGIISAATAVRLVTLAVALYVGLYFAPGRGALVAGVAMVFSVTVESAMVTWATIPIVQKGDFGCDARGEPGPPLTMSELRHFYRPLAVTTILRQMTRPLINAGIAAAVLPRPSLAAWPVVWGLMMLISGPVWSLQQLTTALAGDRTAFARVRSFSLGLSMLFTGVFALLVFTPLYGVVMGSVYSLSPALQMLARPAMTVLVLYPLVMGIQSMLRGLLIREGSTGEVQTAMVVHVTALTGTVLLGVMVIPVSGVLVAALATLMGASVEMVWLRWRVQKQHA